MNGVTNVDFCLARFNVDGSLDTSFDGDGRVSTSIGTSFESNEAEAIELLDDGRIVVAGLCNMPGTLFDLCVARYLPNGSLDTSFDTDGYQTTAVAAGFGTDSVDDLAVADDGTITVAGDCSLGGAVGIAVCVARYNANGSLDTTFGTGGVVTTNTAPGTGEDRAYDITALADGTVVVAGRCDMGVTTGLDVCLHQYGSGGLVDQYDDAGSDDWDTAGSGIGLFGACLQATTLGTPTWTVNATCPTDDGAFWRAVPTTASAIATANPLTATATATLRFGVRVADGYPSGNYVAPVTFSVSAP
jgi:uncharacterized delta-60 repeat protein